MHRRRIETAAGVALALLGAAAAWAATDIPDQPGQVLSAATPPFLAAYAIGILGLAYAMQSACGMMSGEKPSEQVSIAHDVFMALGILVVAGVYVWLFGALGHLVSTLIAAPVLFWLLGCRGWIGGVLVPLSVAVTLHLFFFGLLGLYDAPGWLVDLRL